MRVTSPASGFGGAELVRGLVAQERVEVAHRGKADAVHRRILRRVRELVDVVGDEVPAGDRLIAVPVGRCTSSRWRESTTGTSSRCTRCVSVAFALSSVAAG